MKYFKVDQQTYTDLNIFTESDDSESIFGLFKKTRTSGGRDRLREIMTKPLTSSKLIIDRKNAIQYFQQKKLTFEVSNSEVDIIEYYLRFDKRKSKTNLIDSAVNYLSRSTSNDFYIITIGIKYIIKLTAYLLNFIEAHIDEKAPNYLIEQANKFKALVKKGLLAETSKLAGKKLRFNQITKFDFAFRGKEKDDIYQILQLVYELDVFENVAFIAANRKWCFANYKPSHKIEVKLTDFFHPGLKNPITNSISIKEENNMIFLTGPNMAGKSSLLKAIGLNIYLAHLGFPVPARQMETTFFDGLITTINLPDNINQGLSHYYSEVKRVKEVASSLLNQQKMFVILDELFRGTNVKDAFDASLLIITELAKVKNAVFFISTHIVELAEQLKEIPNISFQYLETFFENQKPVFTYQLQHGISEERLGMYIVQNEGIIDIIKKAHETKA